jgi:hypothetical protein
MKKIFTLLFAVTMFSTAFAQYGQKGQQNKKGNDDYAFNDNHGYDKHDNGNNSWYIFTPRERDIEIAQINRSYDYKIRSVKSQFFISWFHKKRQIRFLEDQRDNEIHEVMHKFTDRRNKFGDRGHGNKNRW